MASSSQAAGVGGAGRSGGKIVKRRRTAARKTPYDRPTSPLQPESPNWFDGLVLPAKFVAGGASKLLSSFWNPKSWGSHSSSSDSDSDSEGVIEDDYEDNENLSDGGVELNQKKDSSSRKSEILHLVEQLLMLGSYSREERDRLIEIINSRVVDCTMRDGGDSELKSPDICNQAIMEARKVITENMVGSSSKSDLDSLHGSKTLMTPNRDHLSAGSWNIQDEVRRLRTRATEELLSNHRSPKLAAFTVEHDLIERSNDKAVGVLKPDEPLSLEAPKPEDETVNLAVEGGSLGLSDMRTSRDDLPLEALSSLPAIEEQNQMAEEQDAAANHEDVHPDSEQNLRQSGEVISLGKEEAAGDDVNNRVEGNYCNLMTESPEVPDVNEGVGVGNVNGSQGSSNTSRKRDSPSVTRAVTRSSRRYNKRGKGRGK